MASSDNSIPKMKERGFVSPSDSLVLDSVEAIVKASVIGFLVGSIGGWLSISSSLAKENDSSRHNKATIDVYGKEVNKSSRFFPKNPPFPEKAYDDNVPNQQQLHVEEKKLDNKRSQEKSAHNSRPIVPSSSASNRNPHLTNLHHSMPRSSFTSAATAPPLQEEMARRVAISGFNFGIVTAVMSSTLLIAEHGFGHDKDSVAFGAAGLTGGLAMGMVQRPFHLMSTIKKAALLGTLTFAYSMMYDQFLAKERKRKNTEN